MMIPRSPFAFLVLAGASALVAPAPAQTIAQTAALAGHWTVDLRLALTDAAYSKPMILAIAADGAVTGEFYDHPIESGRARTLKGRTCFAFHTSDPSGPYQTSGCLAGGTIEGLSWSEGRKFVLPWTATRDK